MVPPRAPSFFVDGRAFGCWTSRPAEPAFGRRGPRRASAEGGNRIARPSPGTGSPRSSPSRSRESRPCRKRAHPSRSFRTANLPSLGNESTGLALWQVADPGNVGTLLRAAEAFGPAFVTLSAGCADPTGEGAPRGGRSRLPRLVLPPRRRAGAADRALVARGRTPVADVDCPGTSLRTVGSSGATALAQALAWSAAPTLGGTGGSGTLSGSAAVAASGNLSDVVNVTYTQPIGATEQLATGSVYSLTATWTVSPT